MIYYNEFDPKAAAWLRELMREQLIPEGWVDDRSIADVRPDDLRGVQQAHFFAGIGGWPYALSLAGWTGPVWTASCPCQPFSAAGKQRGIDDERHLWPVLRELIRECKPPTIFGEQVASKLGREWLAGVFADLEGMGYAVAGADLCAASVGAPHIRQRLYWVAHLHGEGLQVSEAHGLEADALAESQSRLHAGRLADAQHDGRRTDEPGWGQEGRKADGRAGGMEHSNEQGRARESLGLMGAAREGHWSDFDILPCLDGKSRRIESGTFPLAHGVPGRVGLLRGYGNAIVPQVAAKFVRAFMETIE